MVVVKKKSYNDLYEPEVERKIVGILRPYQRLHGPTDTKVVLNSKMTGS